MTFKPRVCTRSRYDYCRIYLGFRHEDDDVSLALTAGRLNSQLDMAALLVLRHRHQICMRGNSLCLLRCCFSMSARTLIDVLGVINHSMIRPATKPVNDDVSLARSIRSREMEKSCRCKVLGSFFSFRRSLNKAASETLRLLTSPSILQCHAIRQSIVGLLMRLSEIVASPPKL